MIPDRERGPTAVLPRDTAVTVVLVHRDSELVSWPLALGRVDLVLVDELARLQLGARRLGCRIWLRDARPELTELLDLVGLWIEMGRVPERSEEGGVETVVAPDDPVA